MAGQSASHPEMNRQLMAHPTSTVNYRQTRLLMNRLRKMNREINLKKWIFGEKLLYHMRLRRKMRLLHCIEHRTSGFSLPLYSNRDPLPQKTIWWVFYRLMNSILVFVVPSDRRFSVFFPSDDPILVFSTIATSQPWPQSQTKNLFSL